jgi:hypothetical protein
MRLLKYAAAVAVRQESLAGGGFSDVFDPRICLRRPQ